MAAVAVAKAAGDSSPSACPFSAISADRVSAMRVFGSFSISCKDITGSDAILHVVFAFPVVAGSFRDFGILSVHIFNVASCRSRS